MIDKNNIRIETVAIKVEQRPKESLLNDEFQNDTDFFVFSLSSDELLKIAKFLSRADSSLGVQRTHKEERDKEIGNFIASEHPFFPNTIIINIPYLFKEGFYDSEKKLLKVKIEENSAYIIDGQHRLKAFASKYSKGLSLNLVVAAYFGLELPTMAEIFTRINYYQKPVSKSLVYDLLDFNRDPEFKKYREAHEIVTYLNEKINSPFYGNVKILGIGSGLISQAALVEALASRYHIIELLSVNNSSTKEKAAVIDLYFNAIRASFKKEWANPNTILSRSVGFNALIKILRLILLSTQEKKKGTIIDFNKYTDVMKNADVDLEDKSAGGFKGVNILAERFKTALVQKGLL